MIPVQLVDGRGRPIAAAVTRDQELHVIGAPYPPLEIQKTRPFRQYLTADGTSAGSNDMGIDGSVAPVDFWVAADATDDRYITRLSFIVAYGTSGQPNEWADGSALSNGTRLFYTSENGEVDIHDALKSNQDMFRLRDDATPTAWEIRHLGASNDFGYIIQMDLRGLGLPFGIKLDRGTKQKLAMTIRDNAGTGADTFDVIATGFDRFQ